MFQRQAEFAIDDLRLQGLWQLPDVGRILLLLPAVFVQFFQAGERLIRASPGKVLCSLESESP